MSDLDNISATLSGYQFQLKQVEAALHNDPTNSELCQLKEDIKQVIKLTEELIESEKNSNVEKLKTSQTPQANETKIDEDIDEAFLSSRPWQVGDVVLAPWSSDNWFIVFNTSSRPGRIVGMELERGLCTVYFEAYDHSETIINLRRPPLPQPSGKTTSRARNKAELEKLKSKKHKRVSEKKSRFKEIEQAHEEDKQKWQNFFNSSTKNKLKGLAKKRPSQVSGIEIGRVGGDPSNKLITKHTIRPNKNFRH